MSATDLKNHNLLSATLAYLATFALLAIFTVFTLLVVGFSIENLIIIEMLLMIPASIFGYLIAQHTQVEYQKTQKTLDELLKESLHEIKIPISTIRANAQMLAQTDDKKAQKRAVRALEATEKLEDLYEELEYFIAKEVRLIRRVRFELDSLIRKRLELLSEELKSWNVETLLEKQTIYADIIGFKKLIDNLLDNAIKYSPEDRKSLIITLKDKRLTIADQGHGIASDELARVYERFYQIDPNESGSGLGLNIVKTICDEHKLAINIESAPNQGTKISIDLTAVAI